VTRLTNLRRSLHTEQPGETVHTAVQTVHVPMSALDRRRVRRRLTAPDGAELRLAFPTGTYLTPGTLLELRDGVAYVVTAAPEDVAAVTPRSLGEAAKVAHAVGNLHRDFVEDRDEFLVLWDAPIELLLTRLGVPFKRQIRPFHGRSSWEHEQ
jgi:urease accessory protein